MGQLTELEVDRVDAVDRPATRRKFLIVKAEDPEKTAKSEAERLLNAANAILGHVRKTAGMALSEDLAAALNELREAAGDTGEAFAKSEATAPAAAAPTATPAAAPAAVSSAAPATTSALDPDALAEKIAKGVVDGLRKALDEDETDAITRMAPAVAPASAQPAGTVPVQKGAGRAMGQGVFRNIVFGGS